MVDYLMFVQSPSSPMIVQSMSRLWNFGFWVFRFGQSLDKFWISMSNLRPGKPSLDWSCTDSVPSWTESGQELYLTFYWTVLWQGLDRDWTAIGFCIQALSNQPSLGGTHFHDRWGSSGLQMTSSEVRFELSSLNCLSSHCSLLCNCFSQMIPTDGQLWSIDLRSFARK